MAASMVCLRFSKNLRRFRYKSYVRAYSNERKNSSEGATFIFIPEVPKDTRETNPIMRVEDYPKFSQLKPDNIISGCAKLAQEYDSKLDIFLEELRENPNRTFEEFCNFLETILVPLQYGENQAHILSQASGLKYTRKLFDRVCGQTRRSKTERFQMYEYFQFLQKVNKDRSKLTDEQQRLLDMNLLECKMTGVDLDGKDLKLMISALKSTAEKEKEFVNKSIFHKSLFGLELGPVNWPFVKHLPLEVRLSTALDKTQPDKGPWKISLLGYVYESFMELCPRREYRFKVWNAFHTVGTHLTTDIRLHTFTLSDDIRQNRWDIAQSFGYENYAQMSMQTKMAGDVKTVLQLLDKYRIDFLPEAQEDLKELQAFAASKGLTGDIKQWDIAYYRRLQCDSKYKMEKVYRQGYFSMENVLNTMFQLCERLFQIRFKLVPAEEVDTWHNDVSVYDVYDAEGPFLARFYLDPYARKESKMRSATAEIGRDKSDVVGVTPISFILLPLNKINFPGVPTLMSYREVLTMFYTFGSALQQMLTTTRYSELSGQRNIETDALHVCSYVMQMFAKKPEVIEEMSEHYQTGKKLTTDEINRLLMCESHMKSFDVCHELYKSAFDIECHLGHKVYWKDIQKEMYNMFMPLELHPEDWCWCSDPTLWVGNLYAAAYYQNLWSEMLACNIMDRFEEVDWDNEKGLALIGKSFRDTFLSMGGGRNAKLVFRIFMGHDHSLQSFVKRNSKKSTKNI